MKTSNIILNTILAFGLATAGSAFAADTTATTPVQDRETIRAQHRAETANMTQEQRDAYRAEKQAAMTPEQRAAMRSSKGNSGKGKGMQVRDGSGTGSQHGAQGGGAGQRGR